MKAYNLLLLTILSSPLLIDAQANSVPDCSSYSNGVYLPDTFSCSNYFVCRNGVALRRRCARGFRFDDTIMYCNFAALVDCSRVSDRALDVTTAASPTDCETTTTTCACTKTTTCAPATQTKTTTCAPATQTKTTTCAPATQTKTTTCAPVTQTKTTTCAPATQTKTTTCAPATQTKTTTCAPPTTTCAPEPEPEPESCETTPPCPPPTTTCPETTPPCPSPTTPCPSTTTECPPSNSTIPENRQQPIYYSRRACRNLPDGTILLASKHCRRFYICNRSKACKQHCNHGYWIDYQTNTCRQRSEVTNCPAACD